MSTTKTVNELMPGIHWVGVEDWNRRTFDALIPLPMGTSYNAYLVVGKTKTALVDTVQNNFADEMLRKIGLIVDVEKIDYVVMNHAEPDHAGAIPRVMTVAKNAKLVVSKIGVEMAKVFYDVPPERTIMVKEGPRLRSPIAWKKRFYFHATSLEPTWPRASFTTMRSATLSCLKPSGITLKS